MPSYIAESYQSRARRDELSSLTQRVRDAAQALTEAGQPVQYLRSAFLPGDEVPLLCSSPARGRSSPTLGASPSSNSTA
jgi:hypothetical protein